MRWISVKDKLPDLLDDPRIVECYYVTDGEFQWMAYWTGKEWVFAESTNSNIVISWTEITHWMPLFELPKE